MTEDQRIKHLHPLNFRSIEAQYETECVLCSRTIFVGTPAAWHPGTRVLAHPACLAGVEEVTVEPSVRLVSAGAPGLGRRR
jgi:hypothetical protein